MKPKTIDTERPDGGEPVLVWAWGKWNAAHLEAEPKVADGEWWIVHHWEDGPYTSGLFLKRAPLWIRPSEVPSPREIGADSQPPG